MKITINVIILQFPSTLMYPINDYGEIVLKRELNVHRLIIKWEL